MTDVPPEIQAIWKRRGQRIAEARHGHMTQEDLAEAAETTQQTISRIERGQQNTSLPLGLKIAAALNKPYDELFATDERVA